MQRGARGGGMQSPARTPLPHNASSSLTPEPTPPLTPSQACRHGHGDIVELLLK